MCKVNPIKRRIWIFTVMFSILAIVLSLFTGCRQANHKEHPLPSQITNRELIKAQTDSLKERLLEKFL